MSGQLLVLDRVMQPVAETDAGFDARAAQQFANVVRLVLNAAFTVDPATYFTEAREKAVSFPFRDVFADDGGDMRFALEDGGGTVLTSVLYVRLEIVDDGRQPVQRKRLTGAVAVRNDPGDLATLVLSTAQLEEAVDRVSSGERLPAALEREIKEFANVR